MKKILVALMLGIVCYVGVSCTKQPSFESYIENDSLFISILDTNPTNDVRVLYNIENLDSGCIWLWGKVSAISIKRLILDGKMDKSYKLATNNGNIDISFIMTGFFAKKEYVQTINYTCHIAPIPKVVKMAELVGNNYGRLTNQYNRDIYSPKVKKWLYENNIKWSGDSIVDIMVAYQSHRTPINLECNEAIPIYNEKELPKYSYVKSDMIADHYVLFLAQGGDDILEFVKLEITREFENCSSSLKEKIKWLRFDDPQTDGVYTIFLIGINNDWSFQTEPIGIVGIDSKVPVKLDDYEQEYLRLMQFDTLNITTEVLPELSGAYKVKDAYFEGFAPYYNVPFIFIYLGDVRYIRVFPHNNAPTSAKTIVIDTKKEKINLFQRSFKTYLELGDNYLPIEVEDLRGNVTKDFLIISIGSTKDELTVDIDNNNIIN